MIGTIIALALLAYAPLDLTFEPYTAAQTTISADGSIVTTPLHDMLEAKEGITIKLNQKLASDPDPKTIQKPQAAPTVKAEPKQEQKPVVKHETKPAVKQEQKPEPKPVQKQPAQPQPKNEGVKGSAVQNTPVQNQKTGEAKPNAQAGVQAQVKPQQQKATENAQTKPQPKAQTQPAPQVQQPKSEPKKEIGQQLPSISHGKTEQKQGQPQPERKPEGKPGEQKVADKVTNLPQEKKQVEPPKQQTHTGELLAKHNNTVNAPIKNSAPKDIGDTIVSLNCSDAKLNEVLDQLTELSKANLVLLSPSESRITLRLKNVKLSEMLRHITSMTGLTYLKSNNAYLIATAEKLKSAYPVEYAATYPETDTSTQVTTQDQPDPVVTKIYTTRYVDSTQLANALKGMFDNQITAVAGPAQMSLSLDQVDTSAATGVAAGSLSNGQAVARAGRKVILRGPSGAVEAALEAANALDQESAQVAIAVKIHDVSNDALRELGISWQWSNVTISEGDARGMNFGSFTRSPLAFNAQIKALEQENRAKLLAEPSIAVLDNEQAYILVGSRLTYPVVIGFTQANTPIFNREEARVGIYLQVAPSIGANDQITMSLKPQVSVVKGYIEVNGGSYPQIDTREAQTTLRVRSGDTIVMGGLIRDEDINQVERVPFLSQIPLLGELFKRRKSTKISSQVIITITPTIIRPTE